MIKIYNYKINSRNYLCFVYGKSIKSIKMIIINNKKLFDNIEELYSNIDRYNMEFEVAYPSNIYTNVINALNNGDNEKVSLLMSVENMDALLNLRETHPELFI